MRTALFFTRNFTPIVVCLAGAVLVAHYAAPFLPEHAPMTICGLLMGVAMSDAAQILKWLVGDRRNGRARISAADSQAAKGYWHW